MTLPTSIRITEVGPRDGLQNEPELIPTAEKAAFISLLARAGFQEIEVTSFVSAKWVPQLGDADELLPLLAPADRVTYSALTPNEKGLDRAIQAGLRKIAIFASASETFSRRNINATISESLERYRPVVSRARSSGLQVRAYISCVVACPFEGETPAAQVRDITQRLQELEIDEVDLGDTIGVASPVDIDRLYETLDGILPPGRSTLHLHDTRGTALACAYRAMQLGVRSFDASCGGLGGCPYAPGSAGNLATEDLVYLCRRCGIETGIDLAALFSAGRTIEASLGSSLRGRVYCADGGGRASCRTGVSES